MLCCRMVIQPLESVALHQADLGRMDALRLSLQPAGYEATETFSVPAAPQAGGEGTDTADEGPASAVRTVMVRCVDQTTTLRGLSTCLLLSAHRAGINVPCRC